MNWRCWSRLTKQRLLCDDLPRQLSSKRLVSRSLSLISRWRGAAASGVGKRRKGDEAVAYWEESKLVVALHAIRGVAEARHHARETAARVSRLVSVAHMGRAVSRWKKFASGQRRGGVLLRSGASYFCSRRGGMALYKWSAWASQRTKSRPPPHTHTRIPSQTSELQPRPRYSSPPLFHLPLSPARRTHTSPPPLLNLTSALPHTVTPQT